MKHFTITFRPDNKRISIRAGATLLEAAGQAGIILNTVCGGRGICKKCAVFIEPDGRDVLACQYLIESDLVVTIPAESRFFEQKILTSGIDVQAKVEPGRTDTAVETFGLAVDIGTTTVVAKLINTTDGKVLASEAAINPQTMYGDDCISRIAYAQTEENLAELHKAIIDCVNQLIEGLCRQVSIDAGQIVDGCFVGNTTMSHIFLKLPVTSLGQAPYKAHSLDAHDVPASELALQINPDANIHTVENIAGFVGSDITAAAVATGIGSAEKPTLLVDIGTNGEIVLAAGERLYAASCAAGPAFEGAGISCGSRAVEGAIEAVVFDGADIDFDVIGGGPAQTICGSGLIDAAALLLEMGIVDRSGRFLEPNSLRGSLFESVSSRVIEQNDQPAFVLCDDRETARRIVITQNDIRQTQLAKAAVRAGIRLLQRKIGIKDNDIDEVLLAGAFGNYIRPESALRIGLLPNVPAERIRFVGNAACSGAQLILVSRQARAFAGKLARKTEYIEIANEKDFTDVFAEAMSF